METKVCKDCKKEFPLNEDNFYKNSYNEKLNKQYYSPYCKPCHYIRSQNRMSKWDKKRKAHSKWKYNIKKYYGITVEEYDAMLEKQDGVCAICGSPPNGRKLSVDHCHDGGHVRGLLCDSCNTGIGHLKDDVSLINAAALYLMRDQNGSQY